MYKRQLDAAYAAPGARAPMPNGLRLCLGAPESDEALGSGLAVLAEIIDQGGRRALV